MSYKTGIAIAFSLFARNNNSPKIYRNISLLVSCSSQDSSNPGKSCATVYRDIRESLKTPVCVVGVIDEESIQLHRLLFQVVLLCLGEGGMHNTGM